MAKFKDGSIGTVIGGELIHVEGKPLNSARLSSEKFDGHTYNVADWIHNTLGELPSGTYVRIEIEIEDE